MNKVEFQNILDDMRLDRQMIFFLFLLSKLLLDNVVATVESLVA